MGDGVMGTHTPMAYLLLALSFALLLAGAVVFTNAVEWGGLRLGLGAGAVGSLLAAVATALPERRRCRQKTGLPPVTPSTVPET